ncbi:MAG: hypothetical protein GF317_01730 [Candidatus Lokiarchaeota archaeon]|nr:hypothetical protein [Candidatus Lokiarchaeota archaeon]MBD3198661.1 hypothetical protein [Candidatus Lokiarchaeota archaeon]
MLSLKDDLNDSLNRINFVYQNQEIQTECIRDFKGISILSKKLGSFKKGNQYRIKLFNAIPLIEHGILKIAAIEKCDNVDVQRYAISERDDRRLKELESKFFLNKVKEFKYFMEKNVRENNKPKATLDKFNSYMSNLIDSRLLKLLRLAQTELTIADEKKLTNSEEVFFKHISEIINTWRVFFLDTRK